MNLLLAITAVCLVCVPAAHQPRTVEAILKAQGLPLFAAQAVRVEIIRPAAKTDTCPAPAGRLVTTGFQFLESDKQARQVSNAILIYCSEPAGRKAWGDLALGAHSVGVEMARAMQLLGPTPSMAPLPLTEPMKFTLAYIDRRGRVYRVETHDIIELAHAPVPRKLAAAAPAQTDQARSKASDLETRLLKALGDLKREAIGDLAKEVGKLKEEDRRILPFRVRPGSVEFRFSGECPGHADYVEFVVSSKNRDYESLLVLSKAELERAEKLWKTVERLAKSGQLKNVTQKKLFGLSLREPALEINLLFVVKGQPRTENLDNLLLKDEGSYLNWEEDGARLNGDRSLDKALAPSIRQPAHLIVIVRPAFLNP